ncbi:MAG: hypothetical protein Q6361_02060 [Candidatus Hermodarchaeota archaeon]|nr:hypothetical protein [Candidatus Hermodarchaeota archaeon]
MPKFGEHRRASIVSFDFKQQGPSQARKTRFFRQLYGYTQQVKQELKNGRVVKRTYHYAGLLDQTPHVKLGKSVFGLRPGTEGPIIKLLDSFDEVIYYNFIGWLPKSLWPEKEEGIQAINELIERYGSLSILLALQQLGGSIERRQFQDVGFDHEFASKAIDYLQTQGWLEERENSVFLTSSGEFVAGQFS